MEHFDVLIIGAGPAGLKCAEVLGNSDLSVAVLEKNSEIGLKVCAGGITSGVGIPPYLEEKCRSFTMQHVFINGTEYTVDLDQPIRTIERRELGAFQLGIVEKSGNVTVLAGIEVKGIQCFDEGLLNKPARGSSMNRRFSQGYLRNAHEREGRSKYVITREGERISFDILVGADGSRSVVRNFLGLESDLHIGAHYEIPSIYDRMVWFFLPSVLKNGYCWIFPHTDYTSCGVFWDPVLVSTLNAKTILKEFLEGSGFSLRDCRLRGFPENYRFSGLRFGNVYLCGDASGAAFPATGEGIYPAQVTGEWVGRDILGETKSFSLLRPLLKHRRKQLWGVNLVKRSSIPAVQSLIMRLVISYMQRYFKKN